jgi:hypothetical protein
VDFVFVPASIGRNTYYIYHVSTIGSNVLHTVQAGKRKRHTIFPTLISLFIIHYFLN